MKIIFRIALTLTAFSLLTWSCAKTTEGDYNTLEQLSLDNWMELNGPKDAQRFDNGMYIETLTAPAASASKVEDGDWLEINFTGTDLSGNVFGTRSELIAREQGTFTLRTHYVPQRQQMLSNTGFTTAEYFAIKRMKMGEKVRIYAPSSLYYGALGRSYSNGYGGQYSLNGNVPVVIEIEIANIIKDITAYENKEIKDYAASKWSAAEKDTAGFGANMYLQILSHVEGADTISVDSTFKYYYIGSFLDGFVFDTNIDTTALRVWEATITSKALSYKAADGGLIQGFYNAVKSKKLTYDSKIRMLIPSPLGYGVAGNSNSGSSSQAYTVIQPYTPLIFDVIISTNKKETTEDKPE